VVAVTLLVVVVGAATLHRSGEVGDTSAEPGVAGWLILRGAPESGHFGPQTVEILSGGMCQGSGPYFSDMKAGARVKLADASGQDVGWGMLGIGDVIETGALTSCAFRITGPPPEPRAVYVAIPDTRAYQLRGRAKEFSAASLTDMRFEVQTYGFNVDPSDPTDDWVFQ
jgi:hypothetical protein